MDPIHLGYNNAYILDAKLNGFMLCIIWLQSIQPVINKPSNSKYERIASTREEPIVCHFVFFDSMYERINVPRHTTHCLSKKCSTVSERWHVTERWNILVLNNQWGLGNEMYLFFWWTHVCFIMMEKVCVSHCRLLDQGQYVQSIQCPFMLLETHTIAYILCQAVTLNSYVTK